MMRNDAGHVAESNAADAPLTSGDEAERTRRPPQTNGARRREFRAAETQLPPPVEVWVRAGVRSGMYVLRRG